MLNHLDGPTLIVTRLPDGELAWTVISPRKVEIFSEWSRRLRLSVEGWVMTGDWQHGAPPDDWDREPRNLPEPLTALPKAEVHRLPSAR